jgi:hypothetical protein
MDKDNITKVLEYYLPEDIEYLYYEKRMYPTWVKRNELINRITQDILKGDEPPKECDKTCQCKHE